MARIDNLTNFLTDVATSIKAKTGDSTAIPASQFDTKILGIQKGKLSNEEYTKANNNLDEILYQSENVLPDAYQEVEYLKASGTQYIDTGYAFTEPELKIEAKYRKTSSLKCNVFGLDFYPNNPRKIHGNIYNEAVYLGNSSVVTNITQALNEDYIFKFEFKNNVAKWLVNGTEYTYNGANGWTGVSDGETDYLFATRGLNGPGYVFTGRIYYVKFYDNNGDLVRNFVPCYRKLDDKPGMYDTVNNVFYTNEGTGEFEVGADVDVLNTKIESILTEKNAKILSANIKNGINILGINGVYTGNLTDSEYAKANNDLDNILSGSENVLPNTYQQVEYLEASGTQYIDTNFTSNINTKAYAEFYVSTTPCGLYSSDSGASLSTNFSSYISGSGKWRFGSGVATVPISNNSFYTSLQDKTGITINGTIFYDYDTTISDFTSTKTITLLRTNTVGFKGKIYKFKLYDGNNIVRNFIPCYRNSDNEAGMYDTVNNVFYTNQGTDDFIVGEDVDVLNTKIESVLTEKNTKILPTNIKAGVNILGVQGSYTGLDTSDANATVSDIVTSKTAYVNGQKLTGSLVINRYYTGSGSPSSSLGNDGDLYLEI